MSGAQNHRTPHGKKLAAVHVTTIPCEANIANGHKESHIFCEIRPHTVYARFEVLRTFVCVSVRVFKR